MDAREWIAAYARELGVEPPAPEEFAAILELAGHAAHASERMAAPVACWLAAQTGRSAQDSLTAARSVVEA